MKLGMNIRLFARSLSVLAVLMIWTVTLMGQATDSNIVGTVTDASGAAVPDVKVVATNRDTNVPYSTVANGAGEYRLNNIPVGTYSVSASSPGFSSATVSGVQLELNRTATVNLNLVVGSVSTAVEVTEAPA